MRLIPAALTMGSRLTPPEGMHVDDTFIPGNIKVVAPRYTIFRRESPEIAPYFHMIRYYLLVLYAAGHNFEPSLTGIMNL